MILDGVQESTCSLSARVADQLKVFAEAKVLDHVDGGLWRSNMLAGNFEQAWQASDRIRARKTLDANRMWTGESVVGKNLIIRSLHGLGDAVQMFRYAPELNTLAESVTWQVPPNLVELARRFTGVERVITWEQPCLWTAQVEITELPYLFRTTLPLQARTRYLDLPEVSVRQQRRRIGLVWAAGEWNQSRSIPLAAFDSILRTRECDFVSLQGGLNAESDTRLEAIEPGLLSLAASIASLGLVITVDTLAAHLAGALNIPAYVLLEHTADWRWMTGREDTPWYPSLRLFRQPQPGDWASPLEAIRRMLGTLTK